MYYIFLLQLIELNSDYNPKHFNQNSQTWDLFAGAYNNILRNPTSNPHLSHVLNEIQEPVE